MCTLFVYNLAFIVTSILVSQFHALSIKIEEGMNVESNE